MERSSSPPPESLEWIDLKVFAHNTPARSLYRELGFVDIGVVRDRFRIGGQSIDDVIMTLDLSTRSGSLRSHLCRTPK